MLACNGYLRGLAPEVERHVMPINNFIAVTEPLGADAARRLISNGAAVSDSRFVVNYFRITPDHRLLFGGGENYSYRFPRDIAAFVRPHLLKVFPQLATVRYDYAWGGTLGITPTRMPWVREIRARARQCQRLLRPGRRARALHRQGRRRRAVRRARGFRIARARSGADIPGRPVAALADAGRRHALLCSQRPALTVHHQVRKSCMNTHRADAALSEWQAFQAANPDIQAIDAFIIDLNGHTTGKRLPAADGDKLYKDGVMYSACALIADCRGLGHNAGGMGKSDGDPDGIARPLRRLPAARAVDGDAHRAGAVPDDRCRRTARSCGSTRA